MKSVPANETTAVEIVRAMRENRFSDFARENRLSRDHFLAPLSDTGWTPLHYGVFSGRLESIKEVLKPTGALFSHEHFLTPDRHGRTPLGLAAVRGNLDDVFVPAYWAGRVGQMERLWKQVPARHRDDIDYPARLLEAVWLSIHQRVRISLADFLGARRAGEPLPKKDGPLPTQDRN